MKYSVRFVRFPPYGLPLQPLLPQRAAWETPIVLRQTTEATNCRTPVQDQWTLDSREGHEPSTHRHNPKTDTREQDVRSRFLRSPIKSLAIGHVCQTCLLNHVIDR